MSKTNIQLAADALQPRKDLAAAVARHAEAIEAHARITAAQQHARETASDSFARLLAAEAVLKEAQGGADDHFARVALVEADAATSTAEIAVADLEHA